MANALKNQGEIKVVGKSWVIRLPEDFTSENDLIDGTQVLLTFKENEKVEAEILPPLSDDLKNISQEILKKRRGVFKELKRIGD